MTFGIGTTLHEDLIHDTRNGEFVNHDLSEDQIPLNTDVPRPEVHFLGEHDIHSKGTGEPGIAGTAIHNATGVRVRDLPLTCDKLLEGLPPA